MHRKFPLVLTLCAWLFATGTQWDLVQTFAWARMFAENSRMMPFGDALARTFSPAGRCKLCVVVAIAKQRQADADGCVPGSKLDGKLLLLFQSAPAVIVAAPACVPWSPVDPIAFSVGRAAPPLPPPRA